MMLVVNLKVAIITYYVKGYADKAYLDGGILAERLKDLSIDKLNLFNIAKSVPHPSLPKGSGTWNGHIHQAEGRQRGLRFAITAYDKEKYKSPKIPKALQELSYAKMPVKPKKR